MLFASQSHRWCLMTLCQLHVCNDMPRATRNTQLSTLLVPLSKVAGHKFTCQLHKLHSDHILESPHASNIAIHVSFRSHKPIVHVSHVRNWKASTTRQLRSINQYHSKCSGTPPYGHPLKKQPSMVLQTLCLVPNAFTYACVQSKCGNP